VRAASLLLASLVATVTAACDDPPRFQAVARDLDEALLAVGGTASDDVWAVGADRGRGPLVLHYDGDGWQRIATGTRGDLWWIAPVPGGPTYLAGKDATILRYDGATFTRMATPGLAAHTIYGLWAAAADEVWAVGSVAGRAGFVWRYDGVAWRDVPVPLTVPAVDDFGDAVGFFKVWGGPDGRPWVVGGRGTALRWDGAALQPVPTPADDTLFTVHQAGELVVAVGGGASGALVERTGDGAFVDRTPAGARLLQGVWVTADGDGWASGAGGAMYRRGDDGWRPAPHDLGLDVESLHATWIDPDGGVWAVGGDVVTAGLDNGAILYRGVPTIPRYAATAPPPPPTPSCPAAEVDPVPAGSIARRWNEQLLGAIRRDVPRPGVHARNLFHLSVALWDAWASYDATADGYVSTTRVAPPADLAAARQEALSYAAYRVLSHRYGRAIGGPVSQACFDGFMAKLGYPTTDTTTTGDGPRAVGNRIGAAVIAAFADDGANEGADYADTTGWTSVNPPLVVDRPGTVCVDPSAYQPLNLAAAETQNGIVLPSGVQGYIGANWRAVTPFALRRVGGAPYFDWGPPPTWDQPEMKAWVTQVIRRTAELDHEDGATLDISPGRYGNNPLGADDNPGHPQNPTTGQPYPANVVPRGDFGRVLAEFWADGPKSETPPGHWNVLANQVSDSAGFARRLGGVGPELDPLAWDVHLYLALNGAVHDAAIAAWEQKREHLAARPITLIRYMAGRGQSSDPGAPSYDPGGLPLVPDLIELITPASSAPGQRHAHLARHVGKVAVRSWRGEPGERGAEVGGVGWIRALDWIPYQRRTFVTPAFPGYLSGHSTFSRAAAEVLTEITGSPYFPGGLGTFTARAGSYLVFEDGPSVDVTLQWATYYDAADQAGQSRLYGGIHILPDDFDGRRTGHDVGLAAYAHAGRYWDGSATP
jgi:hypothetical protein